MNNKNGHIDFHELIIKYLSKEASAEEIIQLEKWVKEDPANKNLFNEYKQSWILLNVTGSGSKIDIDQEWDQLSSKLFVDSKKIRELETQKVKNRRFQILKVAAAVAVLMAVGYLFYYIISKPGTNTLMATQKIESVILPDGSEVTLNHNSTLIYPDQFKKDSRIVELAGDAFFNVTKNAEAPFLIKTDELIIKVLGTSFYVNAKETGSAIEVFVKSGKVSLEALNKQIIILEKGDKGIFNKASSKLMKEENRDPNFISWKTKSLVFDNARLGDVIKKINETYHTKIILDSAALQDCMLTATFEDQPLETILEVIRETFDLKVDQRDGEIIK